MPTLHPYLTFDGQCEKAFQFYKSIFGGEFASIGRFKEIPPSEEFTIPESEADKIMHVSLPIGKHTVLMGSDSSAAFGWHEQKGNNFAISINTDSKEEADRLFNGLSEGGKVTMPMNDAFWGSYFGSLIDQFGIQWMVSFGS